MIAVPVEENLQTTGYENLTPVQMQVIPAVLAGRDLLVCSATGSGKSERREKDEEGGQVEMVTAMMPTSFAALSFLLPIVHLLTTSPPASPSPAVLILSPTRELSLQLEEQAKQLMRGDLPLLLTSPSSGHPLSILSPRPS